MERKNVSSGTIRSVGYDAREQVLEIEFTMEIFISILGFRQRFTAG
ncbi:MAG: hypothetical protein ACREUY_05705 [Burkholderiales bacterium]